METTYVGLDMSVYPILQLCAASSYLCIDIASWSVYATELFNLAPTRTSISMP